MSCNNNVNIEIAVNPKIKSYSESRIWKSNNSTSNTNNSKRANFALGNNKIISNSLPIVNNPANLNNSNNNNNSKILVGSCLYKNIDNIGSGSDTIMMHGSNGQMGTIIGENRVPEIQMINKFYGLIPKKFVICERIRPHTAITLRHKSTARPKSTKELHTSSAQSSIHSSLLHSDKKFISRNNSRQNSISSDNDSTEFDGIGFTIPSVTTRRISFEKLYRKKPKKLLQHSKSVDHQQYQENGDGGCQDSGVSYQRVIRIDLNRMNNTKWDEESLVDQYDDAKSNLGDGDGDKEIIANVVEPKAPKKPTIRKTISFDENVLQRDDLKNTEKTVPTKLKTERPVTAVSSRQILKVAPPETPTAIDPLWTTGKSTAERRAKLQRSFSIKDSSFDGGGESESEIYISTKYPESLVHSGRKSLHVEVAPEVDTMISISKIRNRNQKFQQTQDKEISVPNFELELSRLIIESGAILAAHSGPLGLGVQISQSQTQSEIRIAETQNKIPQQISEIKLKPNLVLQNIETPTNSKVEVENSIPENIDNPLPVPAPTPKLENPIIPLSVAERRKLLKKCLSLPNEKELNRVINESKAKLSTKRPPTAGNGFGLIRQSSLGTLAPAGVSRHTISYSGFGLSNNRLNNNNTKRSEQNRISIKKPLVEITRLRPKTAPTSNTNAAALDRNRRQPLKARSGILHQQQLTSNPKTPSTSTKTLELSKKLPSWTSYPTRADMAGKGKEDKNNRGNGSRSAKIGTPISKDKKATFTFPVERRETKNGSGTGNESESASGSTGSGESSEDNRESNENINPERIGTRTDRYSLPRRSFSLDEGQLLTYSSSASTDLLMDSTVNPNSLEASFKDSKKREECVKIYEKMMKVGCAVRLQTILRGLMTPSEYRNFISAAERAAATAAEVAEAETETKQNLDAGGALENKIENEISN